MIGHNIKKYDIQHRCVTVAECEPETKFEVIPSTGKNYISLSVGLLIKNFESEAGKHELIFEYIRLLTRVTSCPNHSSPW